MTLLAQKAYCQFLRKRVQQFTLTGRGAGTMRHLDVEAFAQANIEIQFLDTSFATYDQRHGEFIGGLSVIDAILNIGPDETRGLIS